MKKIIECVPNFSEGRNPEVIHRITESIKSVKEVKLLDVDPGKGTHRTVVTFAGEPEFVIEAAFLAIQTASQLIDMRYHQGEHPRMGATDVCPLIPVSGITMEETASYAIRLAKRVGEELHIPVYLYEESQADKSRSNLSVIRAGEYEGMAQKMQMDQWKPDFGPHTFNEKTGITAIGARDFLIAYNINLNTTSVRIANRIAFDIREAGRVKRMGDPYTGKIETDENGEAIRIPGTLKHVKAIGWFIEEYGIAQISMNITRYQSTPVHVAFEETVKSAMNRGVRVTGSELVGLIPLQAMLDAGKYFLEKQGRSTGVSEEELIHIAVTSLGLDEITPFDPSKKIIEYLLNDQEKRPLIKWSIQKYMLQTASESPAPGGGSAAALCGALGVSLGTMVANLSADKRGWENKTPYFSEQAIKGQQLIQQLLWLMDEDTLSFNAIIDAIRLPKDSESDAKKRTMEIEKASQYATQIPYQTLTTASEAIDILINMARNGNPNSLSDAAVGLWSVKTSLAGARYNVLINAKDLKDRSFAEDIIKKTNKCYDSSMEKIEQALEEIESKFIS
jgi:glutamate formiminotransferase / formiminotetrahydrofolate cyclodeaminase